MKRKVLQAFDARDTYWDRRLNVSFVSDQDQLIAGSTVVMWSVTDLIVMLFSNLNTLHQVWWYNMLIADLDCIFYKNHEIEVI